MNQKCQATQSSDCPEPKKEFSFPFTPYPSQYDFMQALFRAIDQSKIGVFESPTGTVSWLLKAKL